MSSSPSKDESLQILASMGVRYSNDTKLTPESLTEKLSRAIDMAQRVSELVPNRVNPDTLSPWPLEGNTSASASKPLLDMFRKSSFEECAQNQFRELTTGNKNVPLYTDVFSDVRQTLMSIANNYDSPDRHRIFFVEDAEQSYSITLRLVGVHALNNSEPLLSVIYDHGAGPGMARAYTFLTRSDTVPRIFATILEQKLLIKVLEQNSKRIAPSFKPSRHSSEKSHIRSFLLPLRALTSENIGSLTKSECVRCGVQAGSKCSSCQSVAYCSKDCQRADWKAHREICKPLSKGFWLRVPFSSSPKPQPESDVITTLVMNKNATPDELLKQTPQCSSDGPPLNIHGATPFIVKIQLPVISNEGVALSMMVYDRQRSFTGYILQSTDPDAYARIEATVIMRGIMGLKMYRWAKMVAEWTLEVCLDVEPKETMQW